jgi:hypothetical protein
MCILWCIPKPERLVIKFDDKIMGGPHEVGLVAFNLGSNEHFALADVWMTDSRFLAGLEHSRWSVSHRYPGGTMHSRQRLQTMTNLDSQEHSSV